MRRGWGWVGGMTCEDTQSLLWSLKVSACSSWERLIMREAAELFSCECEKYWDMVFLASFYEDGNACLWYTVSKRVMSFGERSVWHTHTLPLFPRLNDFEIWRSKGWKKPGWHGILCSRRTSLCPISGTLGETLEQWKYIESCRPLFSLRRTIICSWLRTRVHI